MGGGLGVIDVLAGALDLPESERATLRAWYERHRSFFRVLALHEAGGEVKTNSGLSDVFFNSLRFWMISLLADAAVLLRARALLGRPVIRPMLADLMPFQLSLNRGPETPRPVFREPNANPQESQ